MSVYPAYSVLSCHTPARRDVFRVQYRIDLARQCWEAAAARRGRDTATELEMTAIEASGIHGGTTRPATAPARPSERAALVWAEAVMTSHRAGVPDAAYEEARAHFSDDELVAPTETVVGSDVRHRLASLVRRPETDV